MHSKAVALVLGILSFIPPFSGLLRFYLKQPGLGVVYTLTAGGVFIGNILDVVQIPYLVKKANMRLKRRELERSLLDEPGDELDALGESGGEGRRETHRLSDQRSARSLERAILLSAKKNGGCTTASEVALAGEYGVEDARHALDVLVSKGFAEMRVTKTGTVVYCVPDILSGEAPQLDDGL